MKKRITILHERPKFDELAIGRDYANYCVFKYSIHRATVDSIKYYTASEINALAITDLMMVFKLGTFRGEWFYITKTRWHESSALRRDYWYMCQYLGGQFFFRSKFFSDRFAYATSADGPYKLDDAKQM